MKNWTFKNIIKEIGSTLLILFVVSMGLNYIRKPDTSNQLVNIKTLDIYGKKVSLLNLEKDAPTIVHFWATWCPTCKLEAPNIEALKESCNIITIAVNSGSDKELKSFMKKRGFTYKVINDNDGSLAKKFGVEVYPTTFIYDSKGKLRFSEVGYSTTMGLKMRVKMIRD